MASMSGVAKPRASVLVTGATGFVGSALIRRLQYILPSHSVVAGVRRTGSERPLGVAAIDVQWPQSAEVLAAQLVGVTTIIHCAGLAHASPKEKNLGANDYDCANVQAAVGLARAASLAGVQRFIYLSTIKVNGSYSEGNEVFSSFDSPRPVGPYAESKLACEVMLRQLSNVTGIEVVVVRPPLVYGPGVKGNFKMLLNWCSRGLPLPLKYLDNVRSLVAIDNLCDFLIRCMDHPLVPGGVFLISDDDDWTVRELILKLYSLRRMRPRNFPLSGAAAAILGNLFGRSDAVDGLYKPLKVDTSITRSVTGWAPIVTTDHALTKYFGIEE